MNKTHQADRIQCRTESNFTILEQTGGGYDRWRQLKERLFRKSMNNEIDVHLQLNAIPSFSVLDMNLDVSNF